MALSARQAYLPSPAKNFYGDGWLILGDLTGYGRVLKDGYLSALRGAHFAANTIIYYGVSEKAFKKYYHDKLKQYEFDSRIGIALFKLNNRAKQVDFFSKFFVQEGISEQQKDEYGSLIHAGVRAIVTGELSYKIIGLLFFFGLIKHFLLRLFTFRHRKNYL